MKGLNPYQEGKKEALCQTSIAKMIPFLFWGNFLDSLALASTDEGWGREN